jgi:hypothetical protein
MVERCCHGGDSDVFLQLKVSGSNTNIDTDSELESSALGARNVLQDKSCGNLGA